MSSAARYVLPGLVLTQEHWMQNGADREAGRDRQQRLIDLRLNFDVVGMCALQ
jgi:hypothetical protein